MTVFAIFMSISVVNIMPCCFVVCKYEYDILLGSPCQTGWVYLLMEPTPATPSLSSKANAKTPSITPNVFLHYAISTPSSQNHIKIIKDSNVPFKSPSVFSKRDFSFSPFSPMIHRNGKVLPFTQRTTPSSAPYKSTRESPAHTRSLSERKPAPTAEYDRTVSADKTSAESGGAQTKTHVARVVRLRPEALDGSAAKQDNIWVWDQETGTVQEKNDPIGKSYPYNHLYLPTDSTTQVYKNSVRKSVLKACVGFNSTVFTHGQPDSGKTFTMLGNEQSPGLVLLAIGDIFHFISKNASRQFLLRVSCMEIYNEQINDYLGSGKDLKVESTKHGSGVHVKDLTREFIRSPAEFITLLLRAGEARKQVHTGPEDRAAQAHTLFRIIIESRSRKQKPSEKDSQKIRSSVLTFVDLGSSSKTPASAISGSSNTHATAPKVDKSLTVLGQVLESVAEGKAALVDAPFRNSKLTRLLKPSLTTHSYSVFICTINPTYDSREESHASLQFGCFEKQVFNSAAPNAVIAAKTAELTKSAKKRNKALVER